MKRNKIRYQSKPKDKVLLVVSGEVHLKYVDDEAIESPAKGDFMVYPYNDSLNSTRLGEYDSTGYVGYFKVDVWDGKQWCLVLLNDIFPHSEHHFAKKERPADTYVVCAEILRGLKGKSLLRRYREHYELDDDTAGTETN